MMITLKANGHHTLHVSELIEGAMLYLLDTMSDLKELATLIYLWYTDLVTSTHLGKHLHQCICCERFGTFDRKTQGSVPHLR